MELLIKIANIIPTNVLRTSNKTFWRVMEALTGSVYAKSFIT